MTDTTVAVKPGSIVVLANAVGGVTAYDFALVLTVSGYPGPVNEPNITVAYIPEMDSVHLGRGNWQDGLQRVADVPHVTHPEVQSGARPVFWTSALPDAETIGPDSLPAGVTIPGFPTAISSAVFDRPDGNVSKPDSGVVPESADLSVAPNEPVAN